MIKPQKSFLYLHVNPPSPLPKQKKKKKEKRLDIRAHSQKIPSPHEFPTHHKGKLCITI